MTRRIIILLCAVQFGCNADPSKQVPQSPEAMWSALISTEGCLVGAQDSVDGPHEGSCLSTVPWAAFLGDPTDAKLRFLAGRLSSNKPTEIHNCNMGNATEGEMAVFALQHLTKKLWIDYSGTEFGLVASIRSYKKVISEGGYILDQAVLSEILGSEAQREALKAYFLESRAEPP